MIVRIGIGRARAALAQARVIDASEERNRYGWYSISGP